MKTRALAGAILIIILPLLTASSDPQERCAPKRCLNALNSVKPKAANCRNESLEAEQCLGRLGFTDVCYCDWTDEDKYLKYRDNPGLLAEQTCEKRDRCRFIKLKKCYRKCKRAFKLKGSVEEAMSCVQAWNGDPIQCFWMKAGYKLVKSQLTPSVPWKQLVTQALGAIHDGCNRTLATELMADIGCWDFGGFKLSQDLWEVKQCVRRSLGCVRNFLDVNPVCEKARPLVEASYSVLLSAAGRQVAFEQGHEDLTEACEEIWADY